nr:MAG TPA: hypothetical protein [Caudoviricetes sp.]
MVFYYNFLLNIRFPYYSFYPPLFLFYILLVKSLPISFFIM